MSKEQKITTDIKVPNKDLEALRLNFPHCFDKDGNFQLEKFKANLTKKEINFSTESYGLDWLGKSYARLLASDPATTLLKADENHNSKPENANSENLLIKGDNLEVLKHLANAYYEQVKMIYIDPPYNTGSDGFVYEDDRKFTAKELQQLIGLDEEKAKRILDFTQQKSNSHSAWLTFLYPRLYIAKQLLKDDGVIFISIDDNEVAQLRLLMDEVFGEENFVSILLWKKTENIKMDSKYISDNKDYIICYQKGSLDEFNKILSTEERYKLEDDKGKYYLRKLDSKSSSYSKSLDYVIENGGVKYYPGGSYEDWLKRKDGANKKDCIWLWSKQKFEDGLKNNEIIFANGNVYNKVRYDGIAKKPFIDFLDVSSGQSSQKKLDEIFDGKRIFDHPKPIDLVQEFLKMVSSKDFNEVILDFFAGSGTTGDAVMQLNADDSGNRKFILVQIPEEIDSKKNKTAFDFVKNELKAEPTIFEITKERLLRAAKKTKENNKNKIELKEIEIKALEGKLDLDDKEAKIEQLNAEIKSLKQQDLGFKIFETTPIWEDYDFESTELDNQTKLFDESKLSEDDIKALLITWKTYDGIALTQELEKIDLIGYTAYYGKGKLYLMNKGFTTDNLKNLLEKIDSDKKFNPTSIIAFGYHFDSKNLRELSENVKSYANKKNIDIDFITRY